jgi:hypothetical protein
VRHGPGTEAYVIFDFSEVAYKATHKCSHDSRRQYLQGAQILQAKRDEFWADALWQSVRDIIS